MRKSVADMRLRKNKQPGTPPSQVEALGCLTPAEVAAMAAGALARSGSEDGRAGGEPPPTNRWGVNPEKPSLVLSDIGLVERLQQDSGFGNLVIIDWCSITFVPPQSWQMSAGDTLSEADCFAGLLVLASDICGWQFTESRDLAPAGYRLGRQYDKCVVCGFGGVGSRVLLTFTGQAFLRSDSMMPRRIFDFLGKESSSRITRLDMAFDDFEGTHFCPFQAYLDWQNGQFDYRTVRPKFHTDGDFHRHDPDNKGVTVYIGSEGKQLCIYQKGKQLGNPESLHVRAEVRISQNAYSITRDALINPTPYFCGAYPYLALRVSNLTGDLLLRKFEGVVREGSDSIDRVLETIKHQFGKHLHWLRKNYFSSDSELLESLVRDDGKLPPVLQKAEMLISRGERLAAAINEKPLF